MKIATRIMIVIFLPRFICLKKLNCIVFLLNGSDVARKQYMVFAKIEIGVKIGKMI